MTLELQRYYEDRLTMFASAGWNDLIADVLAMAEATDRLSGVTPDTLKFKQGELSIMNWLLQLEKTSKQAYADISVSMPDGAHNTEDDELYPAGNPD